MERKKNKNITTPVNTIPPIEILVPIICFSIVPVMFVYKMPCAALIFPGISFFGFCFTFIERQFWESIVCVAFGAIAIAFGTIELFKNPVLSDGFSYITLLIIIAIIFLISAFLITIFSKEGKKTRKIVDILYVVAVLLYVVVLSILPAYAG